MDRNRHRRAGLASAGFERVPAEVAAESGRTDRRNVPAAGCRQLLSEPAVQIDAVRMSDRQEAALRVAAAAAALRSEDRSLTLAHRTGFRSRMTAGRTLNSSLTIQRNPSGSCTCP